MPMDFWQIKTGPNWHGLFLRTFLFSYLADYILCFGRISQGISLTIKIKVPCLKLLAVISY